MNKVTAALLLSMFFLTVYCLDDAVAAEREGGVIMKLTSPSFKNNSSIPAKFTCEGRDVSPALDIEDKPKGTRSLALIVDDPDAPMKTWVHWVVYDIPPADHIAEGSVPGKEGINDAGTTHYHGPCPPSGTHRYYFKLYALDTVLGLPEGISKTELEKAMQGHILERAELMGVYIRSRGKK